MKIGINRSANEEQLRINEAFIKEHKMKGFIVEDSKATETHSPYVVYFTHQSK
jgi:hypothetical protein